MKMKTEDFNRQVSKKNHKKTSETKNNTVQLCGLRRIAAVTYKKDVLH